MTLNEDDKKWIQEQLRNSKKGEKSSSPSSRTAKSDKTSKWIQEMLDDVAEKHKGWSKEEIKAEVEKQQRIERQKHLSDKVKHGKDTLAERIELIKMNTKSGFDKVISKSIQDGVSKSISAMGNTAKQIGVSAIDVGNKALGVGKAVTSGVGNSQLGKSGLQTLMYSNPITALMYENSDLLKGAWNITKSVGALGKSTLVGAKNITASALNGIGKVGFSALSGLYGMTRRSSEEVVESKAYLTDDIDEDSTFAKQFPTKSHGKKPKQNPKLKQLTARKIPLLEDKASKEVPKMAKSLMDLNKHAKETNKHLEDNNKKVKLIGVGIIASVAALTLLANTLPGGLSGLMEGIKSTAKGLMDGIQAVGKAVNESIKWTKDVLNFLKHPSVENLNKVVPELYLNQGGVNKNKNQTDNYIDATKYSNLTGKTTNQILAKENDPNNKTTFKGDKSFNLKDFSALRYNDKAQNDLGINKTTNSALKNYVGKNYSGYGGTGQFMTAINPTIKNFSNSTKGSVRISFPVKTIVEHIEYDNSGSDGNVIVLRNAEKYYAVIMITNVDKILVPKSYLTSSYTIPRKTPICTVKGDYQIIGDISSFMGKETDNYQNYTDKMNADGKTLDENFIKMTESKDYQKAMANYTKNETRDLAVDSAVQTYKNNPLQEGLDGAFNLAKDVKHKFTEPSVDYRPISEGGSNVNQAVNNASAPKPNNASNQTPNQQNGSSKPNITISSPSNTQYKFGTTDTADLNAKVSSQVGIKPN